MWHEQVRRECRCAGRSRPVRRSPAAASLSCRPFAISPSYGQIWDDRLATIARIVVEHTPLGEIVDGPGLMNIEIRQPHRNAVNVRRCRIEDWVPGAFS